MLITFLLLNCQVASTDNKCLEMESLSPLTTIPPLGYEDLVEDWYLFKGIDRDASEKELEQKFSPVLP